MNKLLELKNINLIKGNQKILSDISFDVKQNDFITIIGPNGAGKTSLIKVILGIFKKTSGEINKATDLSIGYVPQSFSVEKSIPMSVDFFLKLNLGDNKKILHKIINQLQIQYLIQRQLTELSGGEMQKILLARALVSKPTLLILDEAAQSLDISGQMEFYELIKKIYDENKISILMISHDLHMVMSSTKKVICLFKHICCQGEPEAVTKDPAFISIFGNNMGKLFSIYNHYQNHHGCNHH